MAGAIGDPRDAARFVGNPTLAGNVFWQDGQAMVERDEDGEEQTRADVTQATADPGFIDPASGDYRLPADADAGVLAPLAADSPWPLQPEERAIIPDADTRDWRAWKFERAGP